MPGANAFARAWISGVFLVTGSYDIRSTISMWRRWFTYSLKILPTWYRLFFFPSHNSWLPGKRSIFQEIYAEIIIKTFCIRITVVPCRFRIHWSGPLSHVALIREAVLPYGCGGRWSTDVSSCTLCGEGILVWVTCPPIPIHFDGPP